MGKLSRKKKAAASTDPVLSKRIPEPEQPPDRLEPPDMVLAIVCGVAAFLVYLKTICPTIYTSGSGENITAVATLGVPHPPGFPLFCLLGKLFLTMVPAGSIAFRVNLFSALCGSLAVAVLFLAIRTLHSKQARYACAAAALMFAFSRTFWSQAIIAEVYTLNALILAAILWSILRWQQGGSLLPVGVLAGLGLAVHPLQALFFPGWLLLIWKSPARKTLNGRQVLSVAALLFGIAFALHLYPLLRSKSNPALDWGNPENFRSWIAYLTASQYRDRMFGVPASEVAQNLWKAIRLLAHEWTPPLLALPAAGAWILFRRHRTLFAATATSAAITVFYAINYDIPWEIEVYYIPVALVLSFWSAWSLALIARKFSFLRIAVVAIAIVPLAFSFSRNDLSRHRIVEAFGRDILATSPPDSSLVIPDTDAAFALLYLQQVLGQRKDLEVWSGNPNELRELARGVSPNTRPLPLNQLLERSARPVFLLEKVTAETIPRYQQIPHGVLHRVARKGTEAAPPGAIDFSQYQMESYVSPIPSFYLDNRSRTILTFYMISRGDAELAAGRPEEASKHFQSARELAPDYSEVGEQLAMRLEDLGDTNAAIDQLRKTLAAVEDASSYNRMGRLLAESGRIEEARSAFLRALELDPKLAIAHSNLGAIYGITGDLARAEEELQLAVRLDPQSAPARNNLARLYMMTGRGDRARIELQKSLEIDPDQPEVQKQLAAEN